MSTRAQVNIMNENHITPVASLYIHGDGYPEGIGVEIADICKGIKIVDGISPGKNDVANGMGCLAARIISILKLDDMGIVMPGRVYLKNIEDDYDVTFKYEIVTQGIGKEVVIKIWSCGLNRLIFQGTPEEVINEFEDKILEEINE